MIALTNQEYKAFLTAPEFKAVVPGSASADDREIHTEESVVKRL